MAQQQMSEEQVKELQEKIKNMSPEELKEFQKKQCIFCHIISGKVQSKKVYEDDRCLAILDINPANPGHVLLIPREHYTIMPQVPESDLTHLFSVAKTISNAALRALGVQGTNIIVQNGIAAGQKAQHFMVHVIPRKENDGIKFELPQKEIPEKELEQVRQKLQSKLGPVKQEKPKVDIQKLVGIKSQEKQEKSRQEDEQADIPKEAKKESIKALKKKNSGVDLDDIAKVLSGR
ncbi:MAG TPA: HIT domain-containing protein [Candidatus Nanoarchaeia archaeon]|nr:HIT domain-containing protein [Candidatus Nanoarchaeia archaeon]